MFLVSYYEFYSNLWIWGGIFLTLILKNENHILNYKNKNSYFISMVDYEEIHPTAIEYTDYEERYITLRGIKFYYECENCNSPSPDHPFPILFLHGWTANRFRLHPLYMTFVQQKHPVFRLDLRGHGWSEKGLKDYRLTTMKEDLDLFIRNTIIKKFGFQKVIILAHSMGGSVTQLLAIEAPPYLLSLILIASSARWADSLIFRIKGAIYTFIYRLNFDKKYKRKKEGHKYYGLEHFPMWAPEYQTPDRQLYTAKRATIQGLRQMLKLNITKKITRIQIPTLILAGENDIDAAPRHSQLLHKLIPNSKLEIIQDTNHDLSIGKPITIHKIVESFLKNNQLFSY